MSSRRRSSTRPVPSSEFYLGYVEDQETPEMIMKKFEELERVKQQAQELAAESGDVIEGGEEVALTDEQYSELFKNTSIFTVKTALKENEELMRIDDLGDPSMWFSDEEEDNWFGVADEEFWGGGKDKKGVKGKRKRDTGSAAAKVPKEKQVLVKSKGADEFGRFVTFKKKKFVDPTLPALTKIPPGEALTISWARIVDPWGTQGRHFSLQDSGVDSSLLPPPPNSTVLKVKSVLETDFETCAAGPYIGVVMDPPWVVPGEPTVGRITPDDFRRLKLPMNVFPKGIVFIWVFKPYIHQIVKIFETWKMVYVENLAWVKMTVTNKVALQPSPYFRSSHLTCLMFRKEGELELRHQRNPDVVYDFVRRDKGPSGEEDKPDLIYKTIETLLPSASSADANVTGRLLELWSHGVPRANWVSVNNFMHKLNFSGAISTRTR